jgi:hypothetical protein
VVQRDALKEGGVVVSAILRNRRLSLFALVAVGVLLVEWAVTRSAAFARGGPVPLGVFIDVMVVLPLLFALLVLRPARRPLLEAAPLLAIGAMVAGVLLAGRPEMRTPMRLAAGAAEMAVLALLVRRVRAAARELGAAGRDDLLLCLGALTDPVFRVLGLELAVVYYAFAGPLRQRAPQDGEFGYTERSGVGSLLFALGLVVSIEGLAIHFPLHAWSSRAAWGLLSLNAYSLVWLVAAFQAARLRPVVLSPVRLLVRASLLWTVEIPRDAIADVAPIGAMLPKPGTLRVAFGAPPELLVSLRRPVVARGPLGIRKSVTSIALYVDEPEKLLAALRA